VGGGFVRSQAGGAGTVTVTASHPSLGSATATVVVTAQPAPAAAGAGLPSPPATGSVPQAQPSSPRRAPVPKPRPAGPTAARVRTALAGVLSPTGARARIAQLVKRGGYMFSFEAPSSGKLVIDWYATIAGKHGKKTRTLVASATLSVGSAGTMSAKVKLNPAGRKLLRRAQRQRLTATASFTPMHSSTTSRTQIINLRR
jgi:hypothetical protein